MTEIINTFEIVLNGLNDIHSLNLSHNNLKSEFVVCDENN